MAPCGLDGSGGRSKEAEWRSKPKATPEKRRSRELHHDVGPSRSGSTKSDSENRSRPASGKGRSELGIGGVRQARLAGWAFEPEDGTSGLSEKRSGAPV